MSDSNRRLRQYAGLALVLLTFVGGIIGWTWATLTVDSPRSASDSTHTQVEAPPPGDSSSPVEE